MTAPTLILASTSPYRRELLQRLRLPFTAEAPGIDESPRAGESPRALAMRLALAKARIVADRHPGTIVIGSDQVCELDGTAIGKPGTHEAAREQLRRLSGRAAVFHTAVAVVGTGADGRPFEGERLVQARPHFLVLDEARIEAYLRAEKPYDCAGSAKSEGLGIALLASIEADDPTALVGLPLIATVQLLRDAGIEPLRAAA